MINFKIEKFEAFILWEVALQSVSSFLFLSYDYPTNDGKFRVTNYLLHQFEDQWLEDTFLIKLLEVIFSFLFKYKLELRL